MCPRGFAVGDGSTMYRDSVIYAINAIPAVVMHVTFMSGWVAAMTVIPNMADEERALMTTESVETSMENFMKFVEASLLSLTYFYC